MIWYTVSGLLNSLFLFLFSFLQRATQTTRSGDISQARTVFYMIILSYRKDGQKWSKFMQNINIQTATTAEQTQDILANDGITEEISLMIMISDDEDIFEVREKLLNEYPVTIADIDRKQIRFKRIAYGYYELELFSTDFYQWFHRTGIKGKLRIITDIRFDGLSDGIE